MMTDCRRRRRSSADEEIETLEMLERSCRLRNQELPAELAFRLETLRKQQIGRF